MSSKPEKSGLDFSVLAGLADDGRAVLTPNERLARHVRSVWDGYQLKRGKIAWESLPVASIEHWLMQRWRAAVGQGLLPDRLLLTRGRALELWRQIIVEDTSSSGELSLLRPDAAAEMANNARDNLLRWQIDVNAAEIRQLFHLEADSAVFYRWLKRFEQRLKKLQMTTVTDCIASLPDPLTNEAGVPVALYCVEELPPLFSACLQTQCASIEILPDAASGSRCVLHRYENPRAELAGIAHWAHCLHRSEPRASVGIVLGDMVNDRYRLEYLLRREFDCLGGDYASLPVNFSTGITLDRAPVVRDALGLLQLACGRSELNDVIALFQSRYLRLPERFSVSMVEFIECLFATGQQQIPPSLLASLVGRIGVSDSAFEALGGALTALAQCCPRTARYSPSKWAQQFSQLLECWGWPGPGGLDSLEYQQLERWDEGLDEFGAFDEIVGRLSLANAVALLQRCLAGEISQPQSANFSIQVLGPLEAAGLDFDYLWVGGLQADHWPAPARPNPFIPASLQRDRGMPHATPQRERSFSEHLLGQYRRHSTVLIASYADHVDGMSARASALLSDREEQSVASVADADPRWLAQRAAAEREVVDDPLGPVASESELCSPAGGSGLLEDQSQCPFRAFARHRLRAEPLPELTPVPGAAERGSLLHQALYVLYAKFPAGADIRSLDGGLLERYSCEAVEFALAGYSRKRREVLNSVWCELEGSRLLRLFQEWLELERQRPEFTVAALEADIQVTLDALDLRLRVDRIDRLAEGSMAIIDYKSGRCQVSDWLGERPAKPQLLLYGLGTEQSPAALCYAQLRHQDCAMVGIGEVAVAPGVKTDIAGLMQDESVITDWAELNEYWHKQLLVLAREYTAGVATVSPQKNACQWCALKPLCRVGMSAGEAS